MLAASDVARSYVFDSRRIEVLRGLDLTVCAGELAGVVGASGTGKSTLLHILGGLDRPDAGRVTIAGEDLFAMGDDRRSSVRGANIGFVFQFHHLLPEFTALENVLMPAMIARHDMQKAREKAESLFEAVGLLDRMMHRPGKLSGGEQQRVAIIRALINDPKALLADEPTGNLDETTSEEVFGLLKNMVKERSIAAVIVTHNMRLAATMDTVYEMHGGSLHGRA